MASLDDIINQSFREEQNRFNNKKIKTGESKNVAKLFNEVQVVSADCNICYEPECECIQCYQCDFKYCQECLKKIISEFNKCSACQANFKDNYEQLKEKNKKNKNKPINTSIKVSTINNSSDSYNDYGNNDYSQDLLSDYEIEQLAMLLQMENMHLNTNTKHTSNTNNSSYTSNSGNTNNTSNSSNTNKTNNYLDNEFDDEIESCQFQNIRPNARCNFDVQQNKDTNELIYTSNDSNLGPIIINYKLLDKYFQRTVFICLVELINKPDIFPNVWQTISAMIYNFTCNYNYLLHCKNFQNQAFIYQKQDLINIFNQMASYN